MNRTHVKFLVLSLIGINISCDNELPTVFSSLISISKDNGALCEHGGIRIETGLDQNNNQILDSNEVTSTEFVCNGAPGANGKDGLQSLFNVSPYSGSNCQYGGYYISAGLDLNSNGILDNIEVTSEATICNGQNGLQSLLTFTTEPKGTNCYAGGYKVNSGIDSNKNGSLDQSEVTSTSYVCNGTTIDTSGTPAYTLNVNGKDNCILLNTSPASMKFISPGTFLVSATGNAYYAPEASHGKVLIRYSGSDDDHIQVIPIGGSKELGFRSGKLYAFFADWDDLNDNSGNVNLSFGSTNLVVNGKTNCILLNTSVAAKTNIPAGTYAVKVKGNAYFAPESTHYNVFIRYAGADGDQLDMLTIGGQTILNLRNGNGFYAFFADWDSVNDNSGTVSIEFYPQ